MNKNLRKYPYSQKCLVYVLPSNSIVYILMITMRLTIKRIKRINFAYFKLRRRISKKLHHFPAISSSLKSELRIEKIISIPKEKFRVLAYIYAHYNLKNYNIYIIYIYYYHIPLGLLNFKSSGSGSLQNFL